MSPGAVVGLGVGVGRLPFELAVDTKLVNQACDLLDGRLVGVSVQVCPLETMVGDQLRIGQ
ncbi:MAG: hypothetical protein ACRDTT_05870 [Pseudonocardiaceae bacterium]